MNAGFGARFAALFFAAFFAAFFGAAFFTALFFAAAFFGAALFTAPLFAAFFGAALFIPPFFAGALFAAFFADFFAAGFLAAAFLPDFFLGAITVSVKGSHSQGTNITSPVRTNNDVLSLYAQQENLRGCHSCAYGHLRYCIRDRLRNAFDTMSEAPFTTASNVLAAGELHVWSTPLISDFPSVDRLADCLSREERARAARARDAAARARFITARIALRHILAGYLRRDPHSLPLRVEGRGKPVVDEAHGIHFSLSHARDLALLAFAPALVGIDVEHLRTPRRLTRVARRVMHADTCAALEQLPAHRRGEVFIHAWTQREAHVKALGGGLFHTADTVPFAPVDDTVMGTIRHVHDRAGGALWSIAHFRPDTSTVGAVVARGDMHTLRFLLWSPEHGEPQ